jgi:hypothetical protein
MSKNEPVNLSACYHPIVRKAQARGASEIERERPIRNPLEHEKFEVEKCANEMFVNRVGPGETIGV